MPTCQYHPDPDPDRIELQQPNPTQHLNLLTHAAHPICPTYPPTLFTPLSALPRSGTSPAAVVRRGYTNEYEFEWF